MDPAIIVEYGSPRIAGTRITVYDIVHYLEAGDWSHAQIADILRLTPEQVLAAVQYIEAHKSEVMAVHREIEERIARGNPPEIEAKREASRAKVQAWFEERRRGRGPEANGEGNRG
jgi:uncharacterized protein (DUF433 family)